jgi:hypothetical protein
VGGYAEDVEDAVLQEREAQSLWHLMKHLVDCEGSAKHALVQKTTRERTAISCCIVQ